MQALSWDEVRDDFVRYQPELVTIIDTLAPNKHLPFYKLALPYGALLTDQGRLQYGQDQVLSAGLITRHQCEIFMTTAQRIVPYILLKPGDLFGFSTIFNRDSGLSYQPELPNMMSISAGVRSLFCLSKLSDRHKIAQLARALGRPFTSAKTFLNHGHLFRELAAENDWRAEMILFGKEWLAYRHDPAFAPFYLYMLQNTFKNQVFQRDFLSWQVLFADIAETKSLKYQTYTLDTVKHLFALAAGVVPGFAPQIDEESAPTAFLKQSLEELYHLEQEVVLMGPAYFENDPIYYALAYPTLLDYSLKLSGGSQLKTLALLPRLIQRHLDSLQNQDRVPQWAKKITMDQFRFYHSDPAKKDIASLPTLLKADTRFSQRNNHDDWPWHSLFLKGLIGVS